MRKATKELSTLLWGPDGARLNFPGASVDLGLISLADAQKIAYLRDALLVVYDREPESAS